MGLNSMSTFLFDIVFNISSLSCTQSSSACHHQSFNMVRLSLCRFDEPKKLQLADGAHKPRSVQDFESKNSTVIYSR